MKKTKEISIIVIISLILIVFVCVLFLPGYTLDSKFKKAVSLMELGDTASFEKGVAIFADIKDQKYEAIYSYCKDYISNLCEQGNYSMAQGFIDRVSCESILQSKDMESIINYADYHYAKNLESQGGFQEAYYQFVQLGEYEDSITQADRIFYSHPDIFYEYAIANFDSAIDYNIEAAKNLFKKLGDYRESKLYLSNITFLERISGTYTYYGYDQTLVMIDKNYIERCERGKEKESTKIEFKEINNQIYAVAQFSSSKAMAIFEDSSTVVDFSTRQVDTQKGLYFRWADVDEYGNVFITNYNDKEHLSKRSNSTASISEPRIGMTAQELENSSWGSPEDINKTTYGWGTKEQWCYPGYKYIYLEDGIVTSIQE